MANTRIQLHSSGTSTNQPSLGVLANGEIAINFADGIIYYKTDANALGEIKTTTPSGLDTEIQFNDGGDFGANSGLTFTKGTGTLAVGTSLTVNSVDIPGRLDSAYGHANAAFTAANNAGGEVVDDTTPQLGGNLDLNGNDIQLDGTAAFIDFLSGFENIRIRNTNTSGSGNFINIESVGAIQLRHWTGSGTENMLIANGDGSVDIYYNNSKKLETTSSGIQTTGTLNINGAYAFPTTDGSANQILKTDGNGALTFADESGGTPFTFNEYTGTGNNSDTTFALGFTPNSDLTCIVTLDGIVQPDSAYNISGSNITFTATPEQDVNIRVLSMASAATLVQVGDGTVFANSFAQSANTHIEEIGIRMSIAMG
jgi:hypothetical protein